MKEVKSVFIIPQKLKTWQRPLRERGTEMACSAMLRQDLVRFRSNMKVQQALIAERFLSSRNKSRCQLNYVLFCGNDWFENPTALLTGPESGQTNILFKGLWAKRSYQFRQITSGRASLPFHLNTILTRLSSWMARRPRELRAASPGGVAHTLGWSAELMVV